MSVFRLTVVCLAVSLSVSALAGSVSDVFPGLTPVVEFDAKNAVKVGEVAAVAKPGNAPANFDYTYAGQIVDLYAIPNSGSRANTSSLVSACRAGGPGSEGYGGAPNYPGANSWLFAGPPMPVLDDDRPYMSFQDLGVLMSSDGQGNTAARLSDSCFDIAAGYTLVGYYRFAENFYTVESTSLGMEHLKGDQKQNSLLEIGSRGNGRSSLTTVTGGGSLDTNLSEWIPTDNSWFQLAKVFNPAAMNPATNEMGYKVEFYVNGEKVHEDWCAYGDANDSFAGLNAAMGDVGFFQNLHDYPQNNVINFDYGYFAAFDTALSAGQVARSYQYITTGVPEPATMTLLALGGLAMLRRRRA